jgi:hypothetical protein
MYPAKQVFRPVILPASITLIMKKYFLWAWLLLIPAIVSDAQISHGPTIHFGYQGSGIKPAEMNRFVSTFNQHYEGVIPKPLKAYSVFPSHGFNAGIGYRFFKRESGGVTGYVGYSYAQTRNRNTATFKNRLGYDFGMKFRDHFFYLEAGAGIRGRFFVNGCLDFLFRKTTIRSSTVYQDGTKSIGSEYDINGMYTGTTNAFAPGISLGGRVWHFFIVSRLLYTVPLIKSSLYLTDYSVLRMRSHDFPQDFEGFLVDVTGENQENGIKSDGFNGLLFQLNIEFMIPIKKK